MELFIKIVDGQPFEHPILGENFRQIFPDIDAENLPSNFARFERVVQPMPTDFQVVEGPVYQWVDGIVKDVWILRDMTEFERNEKIALLTTFANSSIQSSKESIQALINSEANLTIKNELMNFLSDLNAWVLVDPTNPNFPIASEIIKNYYR
jgi:hypothetical protein